MKHEERLRETFNRLKGLYDTTWDPTNHTLHVGLFGPTAKTLPEAYTNATEDLISRLHAVRPFTKDSYILDAGCGAGRTLTTICERFGCRGIGVDVSDAQIKDAEQLRDEINECRVLNNYPGENTPLGIHFIRGSLNGSRSGSRGRDIHDIICGSRYTHILSQDALLFITNKTQLFRTFQKCLFRGGALGIVDFLSEDGERTEEEKRLVYKSVPWKKGPSFELYGALLRVAGFKILTEKRRNQDMIRTYRMLAKSMPPELLAADPTYRTLRDRYREIVRSVQMGRLGWGLFVGQKV